MASATFAGVRPAGQDDAAADGRALGQRPVEHLARARASASR